MKSHSTLWITILTVVTFSSASILWAEPMRARKPNQVTGDINKTDPRLDPKYTAIKKSKTIKDVVILLQKSSSTKCAIAKDESGDLAITFSDKEVTEYVGKDLMTFSVSGYRVGYLCSNKKTIIIEGRIGDGGQTTVESVQTVFAN